VKIIIRNFQKKIPINPKRIKRTILKVLSSERPLRKSGEIAVSFVSNKRIKELNKRFLGKNNATDVLAFDLDDQTNKAALFVDIIISVDEALRNAKIFRTTLTHELNLYAAHGLLHLLGYDDHTQKDLKIMRKKEREYVHT
jgi:probable rRNA maturation factor